MGRPTVYKENELLKIHGWTLVVENHGYIVKGPGENKFWSTLFEAFKYFYDAVGRETLLMEGLEDYIKFVVTYQEATNKKFEDYMTNRYLNEDKEFAALMKNKEEVNELSSNKSENKQDI